ncbi:MAG: hypothetical protein ACRBHB_18200 [Arenicella sp.]
MGDLTPDFSLHEALRSETAKRKRISNKPNLKQFQGICQSAVGMQFVRDLIGRSISPSSWLRVDLLNIAVGSTSEGHKKGVCIDFGSEWDDIYDVFVKICKSEIPFSKIIFEDHKKNVKWIHIEFDFSVVASQRGKIFRSARVGGKVVYKPLTVGQL